MCLLYIMRIYFDSQTNVYILEEISIALYNCRINFHFSSFFLKVFYVSIRILEYERNIQ